MPSADPEKRRTQQRTRRQKQHHNDKAAVVLDGGPVQRLASTAFDAKQPAVVLSPEERLVRRKQTELERDRTRDRSGRARPSEAARQIPTEDRPRLTDARKWAREQRRQGKAVGCNAAGLFAAQLVAMVPGASSAQIRNVWNGLSRAQKQPFRSGARAKLLSMPMPSKPPKTSALSARPIKPSTVSTLSSGNDCVVIASQVSCMEVEELPHVPCV